MRALVLLVMLAGVAAPARAQQGDPPLSSDTPQIDATKLGVSLDRIQKALETTESRENSNPDGLRISFDVLVFGTAPRIEVLQDSDLFNGAVPGSAPTHQQFIEWVTPQIYRTPTMPISSIVSLAAKWFGERSAKSRCEEEIANYRALVMQGVNVSAPTCAR